MSTRATYRFENRLRANCASHPALTLYIHHDGYPSGAAAYFWEAHHFANWKGGLVMQFIRANPNAELTDSHEIHGDTEYRYSFTDGTLKAEKSFYDSADTKRWRVIFEGPYWEFINQNPQSIDGFTPIRELGAGTYGAMLRLSRQQLTAQLTDARASRDSYYARFPGPSGNGSMGDEAVKRLEQALADYDAMTAFEAHPAPVMVQQ